MEDQDLIRKATEVLANAYAPYSQFRVGACAVTPEGEIFTGCNVENASLGLTICAERAAIFAAVAHGRKKIDKIVVVGDRADKPALPCGACLQVMNEFGVETVVVATVGRPPTRYALADLLPRPFSF